MLKGTIFIISLAVITAFTINYFSPTGIALVGQWDPAKGVVSARPKDDVVVHEREIGDIAVAKKLFGKHGVVFVDARPTEMYADAHISGAVTMPVGNADDMIEDFLETYPPETHLITYCTGRECEDSHMLADMLVDLGYMTVQVFVDGFPAWKKEGYPIE